MITPEQSLDLLRERNRLAEENERLRALLAVWLRAYDGHALMAQDALKFTREDVSNTRAALAGREGGSK